MPVRTFRKRPVEIQAVQWTGDNTSEIIDWVLDAGNRCARWREATAAVPEHIAIDTLEGTMRADVGDWIIRGTLGEHYPCKPDAFEAAYETPPAGRDEHVTVLPSEFFDTLLDDSPAQPVPELMDLFKRHRVTPGTAPNAPSRTRADVEQLILKPLHDLDVRIHGLPHDNCQCNLVAQVILDALGLKDVSGANAGKEA